MMMNHPGLPDLWAIFVLYSVIILSTAAFLIPPPKPIQNHKLSLQNLPILGAVFRYFSTHLWPLFILKILFVALFILIIIAGLWGTQIPERNVATVLTWNLWWAGIIIAVLFSGSAWCAVCPWNTIANWLVKHRLWRHSESNSQMLMPFPRFIRNLWPAILLFCGFTWLELGIGIVANPYATALLALLMVLLSTLSLVLWQGQSFCRYICPVGRTIGVYSQLSTVSIRPIDSNICRSCKSLNCYNGDKIIAPCPSSLIVGRLTENTYCISCGNCSASCPSNNVGWQLRSPSAEAIQDAKSHTDEAWFMLILLSLTLFHGVTMLEHWQSSIRFLAQRLNDSGQLIISFSVGLAICTIVPIAFYALSIGLMKYFNKKIKFIKLFNGFAFTALPLAFSYHLSHNLNHLVREGSNWWELISNPLGIDSLPLSMAEKHERHMTMFMPEQVLFFLQATLLIIGLFLSIQVIRHRGLQVFHIGQYQLAPMFLFASGVTILNLWLIMQPMVMRM